MRLSPFWCCFVLTAADTVVKQHDFDFTNHDESKFYPSVRKREIGDQYDWQEGSNLIWQQVTSAVLEGCCNKIRLSFVDTDARRKQDDRQGVYNLTSFNHNNKAEYHQEGGYNIVYFYRNLGWYVGGDYDTSGIQSESSTTCPVEQTLWRYWKGDGEGWSELEEGKIEVTCVDVSIGENIIPSEEPIVGEGYIPRGIDGPNDDCSSYSYDNLPHPRIMLFGETGVGKSVLSNQLLGCYYKDESCRQFSVGHGSLSHTNETSIVFGNYLGKGRCVTIIDTPGVLDFSDRDYAHTMEIVNVVRKDIKAINVFLLLFSGSKPRFHRPVVELLKLYQSIFSNEIWKNTITEFTFWKHDEDSVEERLEEQEMDEERKHKEWNVHYKEKIGIEIEIPSIFIDPVFPIFSKKDRHIRKVERQPEAKASFQLFTYLLMDLAKRMPAYRCQGQCNAPDGFFFGAPVIKINKISGRENARILVTCQIWKGYEGHAADDYVWKYNEAIIYQKKTIEGQDMPTIKISSEWKNKIQVVEVLSPGAAQITEIQLTFLMFEISLVGTYSLDNGHASSTNTVEIVLMKDGFWGEWEEWQSCSKTCLQEQETPGSRQRRRVCIEHQNGGLPCISSEDFDREVCAGEKKEMRFCPLDYSFNEWSEWSGCSRNCGDGVSTRYRLCNQGRYGGLECPSLEDKEEKWCFLQHCTAQPVTGCTMNDWSTWSACTKTCLDINNPTYGTRSRQRRYQESNPNNPECRSELMQIDRKCAGYGDQVQECPRDASWGQWSEFTTCSVTCEKRGNKRRYRSCIEGNGGGSSCSTLSKPTMESISCYSGPCPSDCQWSNWGTWEQCDRNYGQGNQIRRRNIVVFGKHEGITCQQSDSFEQRECFVQSPPCRVGEWSDWSPDTCIKSAEQDYQARQRSFISEDSKFTGYDCSQKEKEVESRPCQGCPAEWHSVINSDEHHCYRVLKDIPRNWTESRVACRQANGYLAEITSKAENDAVLKYLRENQNVDVGFWIGLNDRETENQFEWSKSKTKLGGFSYWETIYSREPNNGFPHWGEEDCVFLYARALSVNRKWNDLNCKDNSEANIPLYALCEYDFEDFAVKDCVHEDESFLYCKVGVKPGTTMGEGSVAQTCREVGMEAVCSGNQHCKYSSSDCVVTPLSTKCAAPMYSLSKQICNGRQPRDCPALEGVFSHMTGLSGGECGVVDNTWCAKGNDVTAQNTRQYFAYCAEKRVSANILRIQKQTNKQSMQCRIPHETLNQSWRKVKPGNSGNSKSCLDRSYSFKKQWYRFSDPAGSQMLTAPSTYEGYNNMCSHDRAGWMNRTHPRVGEEPVRGRICFASRHFGDDCKWSVEIQVIACQEDDGSTFYLYELPPTPQCSLVYCAQ